jgi:hypothetical protein
MFEGQVACGTDWEVMDIHYRMVKSQNSISPILKGGKLIGVDKISPDDPKGDKYIHVILKIRNKHNGQDETINCTPGWNPMGKPYFDNNTLMNIFEGKDQDKWMERLESKMAVGIGSVLRFSTYPRKWVSPKIVFNSSVIVPVEHIAPYKSPSEVAEELINKVYRLNEISE